MSRSNYTLTVTHNEVYCMGGFIQVKNLLIINRAGAMGDLCPPKGKRRTVFWKVIGYQMVKRLSPLISGELFGLRVENKNRYISKLAKK